jgi:tetratricopeptide (TPR) repeat protein
MNEQAPQATVDAVAGSRAKVFVSYSRKDLLFAQSLVEALTERGFDAFLDKTDIAPGEPWKERLGGLIAAADTVVFAISPDSVASTVCAWELDESARLGKRLIPVVARRIPDADAPPALGRLNWVFCTESDDKDAALTALDTALHTDLPWVREHTRLGELARHWDEQKRSRGATLRGADLDAAERWLDRRPADANAPTDLHQDFIRASRRAATMRQRYWVGGSLAVAIVAIGLAVFAEISRREAQTQRDRAEHTLTLATGTANGLVFNLAQKFRNVVGVPASTIKDILDRSRQLQDQLYSSGESTPALRYSQVAALDEVAKTLLTLGDTKSALDTAKQSQGILQDLVAKDPNSAELKRDLSVSYATMGNVLDAQGDLPGALKAYQISLDMIEALARSDPKQTDWQDRLSVAYSKTGDVLVKQNRLPEALQAFQASLKIMEQLTATDPSKAVWHRRYEITSGRIADILLTQGHLEEALKLQRTALERLEVLAKADPGNAEFPRDMSVANEKIGNILMSQGDLAEAIKFYQASLAIDQRLAKSDPDNTLWQDDVAASYGKIGDVYVAQGHLDEALASFQSSLDIREREAKADSSNAQTQLTLAIAQAKIGDVLYAQQKLTEALASYQSSFDTIAKLAESDATNMDWQADLALAHQKIGDVLSSQDKLAEALQAYQAKLDIDKRLAQSDASNTDRQRELAVADNNVGDVLLMQGKGGEALQFYHDGFDTMRALLKTDPSNGMWQSDLSVSYVKMGLALQNQSNQADALKSFQAALEIMQRVSQSNPADMDAQRRVSVLNSMIGDVLKADGKIDDALASYRESLALMKKLTKADPENEGWKGDLQFSVSKVGGLAFNFELAGNFATALQVADEAIALAPDQIWLYTNKAHALMFLGRTDEARELYRKYRGTQLQKDKPWEAAVLEDFAAFRKAQLSNPLMDEIEKEFSSQG